MPFEVLLAHPILMEQEQCRIVRCLMHIEINTTLFRAGRRKQVEQLLPDLCLFPCFSLESNDDCDLVVGHSHASSSLAELVATSLI